MSRVYINAIASISPQQEDIFTSEKILEYHHNIIPAIDQNYKEYIKPMLLRRMSKAVKMGLLCSKRSLKEAGIDIPEAIFVGTGQGCMQDTEKFLEQIESQKEQLLSPTSFIQSTHNTVGGQMALDLKCTGYNMTYTQDAVSFESALKDAYDQFQNNEINSALVGGVEENAKISTGFQYYDHQLKAKEISNLELFESSSPGTITSESAAFFVLQDVKTDSTYAEVHDLKILNEVSEDQISEEILQFLEKNGLESSQIDAVMVGRNGDSRFDHYYETVLNTLFQQTFQLHFKHLVGDNNAISSYAVWLCSQVLKFQKIPEFLKRNTAGDSEINNILIYNQYLGKNHGIILLQR